MGVADLVGCHQVQRAGVVDGIALCTLEQRLRDVSPGRFALQLANPHLLSAPVLARGKQGKWDWPAPPNLEELLTLKTPAEMTP